jgi:hypothetical protein
MLPVGSLMKFVQAGRQLYLSFLVNFLVNQKINYGYFLELFDGIEVSNS